MAVRRFGPFILERMIGRGGMGAVYRARREDNGQIVAVKALLLPLEQERERFSAEIETMKLLRHDNIVRLYGFGQEDGILYYAMEYVDGPSLSTLLKRGRQFSWEEAVYIGASVCRALKHAHDRGIVHRDVKPANILLENDGTVKVSDYGIAQYFGSSRLTGAHQVVGTIEFMAPEQAQAGALTPHTDMYSLGALMYVLLTGKPPYIARDLAQLLQRFKQGAPESVRASRPEIPKVVDDVIFDLLQLRTEKRPGDARVIGRRLEAILKTSPNCPADGNPFSNNRLCDDKKQEEESNESASRVDLENPSGTTRSANDYVDSVPDFPYRAVGDEEEPEQRSPFEATTEVATDVNLNLKSQEELERRRSDFVLVEEKSDYSGADLRATRTIACDDLNALNDDFLLGFTGGTTASERTDKPDEQERPSEENDFIVQGEEEQSEAERRARVASARTVASELPRGAETLEQKERAELAADGGPESKRELHSATTVVEEKLESAPISQDPPAAPSVPVQGKEEPKDESRPLDSDELEVVPLSKFKRSQFTPVDENELDKLPRTPDEDSRYVWLRIACMLIVFLGIVCLFANLFRTPNADKMYARFERKLAACPSSQFEFTLRRCEKEMNRFVETYPNDLRVKRVRYFLNGLETDDLGARLERQIVGSGRILVKQPMERAYVEACRVASEDWTRGEEKLRAFIVMFDTEQTDFESLDETLTSTSFDDFVGSFNRRRSTAGLTIDEEAEDDKTLSELKDDRRNGKNRDNLWLKWNDQAPLTTLQERLVYLAKRRLVQQKRETKKSNLADLALLNDRINSVLVGDGADFARAETMYRAAMELYGDENWAQGALREMREKLDRASDNCSDGFTKDQASEGDENAEETNANDENVEATGAAEANDENVEAAGTEANVENVETAGAEANDVNVEAAGAEANDENVEAAGTEPDVETIEE